MSDAASQIRKSPEPKRLAEELRLLFWKFFIYLPEWWWKVERRQQEVDVAEVSGTDVLVLPPLLIRVCQKVSGSTALEVPDRCGDVPVREVNETIATENHIGARKPVSGQVEQNELRPIVTIETLVPSDEIGNDIDANVSLERRAPYPSSS